MNIFDTDPNFHIRILDTVVETLVQRIASAPPEQGAVLYGQGGVITFAMHDTDGDYSSVHWTISEGVSRAVDEVTATGLGNFIGTVHSHPGAPIDPSHGDVVSNGNILRNNPHLKTLVAGIITEGAPFDQHHIRLGSGHRMSLSVFYLKDGSPVRIPVRGVVVPARSAMEQLGVRPASADIPLSEWDSPRRDAAVYWAGKFVSNQSIQGMRYRVDTSGPERMVTFPLNYPISGPVITESVDGGSRIVPSTWNPSLAPCDQDILGGITPFAGNPEPRNIDVADSGGLRDRTSPLVGDLGDKRVLILGSGSVGSRIAEDLARAGVGYMTLVDPDVVTPPNLARSSFTTEDLGFWKVDALRNIVSRINPEIVVSGLRSTIGAATSLRNILHEMDLVVGATDDMAQQMGFSSDVYRAGVPMICCAMYRLAHAGEVVISVPSAHTACIRCSLGNSTAAGGQKVTDYGVGRLESHPGLGASINLVSSMASLVAIGVLAGPDSSAGEVVLQALSRKQSLVNISSVPKWDYFPRFLEDRFHQNAPQSMWVRALPSPDCSVCGANAAPVAPSSTPAPEGGKESTAARQ